MPFRLSHLPFCASQNMLCLATALPRCNTLWQPVLHYTTLHYTLEKGMFSFNGFPSPLLAQWVIMWLGRGGRGYGCCCSSTMGPTTDVSYCEKNWFFVWLCPCLCLVKSNVWMNFCNKLWGVKLLLIYREFLDSAHQLLGHLWRLLLLLGPTGHTCNP